MIIGIFSLFHGGAAFASAELSSEQRDHAARILEESERLAENGDANAIENVKTISGFTATQRDEFNTRVEQGDIDVATSANDGGISAQNSLQVTATCDQNLTVLGVNLVTIRMTGTYFSSQLGAVVDRTTGVNAALIHSYDPTIQGVDFSNQSHSKVNDSLARFSSFVNVHRGVGPVNSIKSGTFQMTANGYQVVQSCTWVDS